MRKNILIILSTLFIFSGCSPMVNKYHITIETITAPNLKVTPTTYTIKALGKDTDENSLKFQYHADILKKLLRKEKYRSVESITKAKEIIYFDYGIEKELEKEEQYREPDVGFGISIGNSYRHGYSPFWSEFGYSHYRSYRKRTIYYNRYITLLAKDKLEKELWRVDVSTIGESKNLKVIVPILIESAIPYIGKNSNEPIKIVKRDKKE